MTPDQALRESAAWVHLPDRGVIAATGEDRARLLHAMCTNDVQSLKPGQAVYAFFLNAQGRILSDAWILCQPDALWIDVEPECREKVFTHLDKFIIADDVTLEDISSRAPVIELFGPRAADFAPPDAFALTPTRHRVYAEPAGVPQTSFPEWNTARLEQGIPRYGLDILEKHLAHETRQMHAVSFTKGCYLGQEIVERVRSRGAVHKHLTPIRIPTDAALEPGTEIVSGEARAGELFSSAWSPALATTVALAMLGVQYENAPLALRGGLGDGAEVLVARP
jgi:aminomethyltransferase